MDKWQKQLNNYYKKEYVNAIKEYKEIQNSMGRIFQFEKPLYQEIFKNKQIIFIWEDGGHAVPEIISNKSEIIQQVRKANPAKRILLASEFLVWTEINPFENSPLLNNTKDYRAPVVLFAGEEMPQNFISALNYENYWQPISKAGIDVMSLDDLIIEQSWLFSFLKVGNISVPVKFSKDFNESKAYWHSSLFGIHQRNSQWNTYIRAVAPYYDVIIVNAGGSHYGLKKLLNMSANAVIDIFIDKLSLNDDVKQWNKTTQKTLGFNNETSINDYHKNRDGIAKTVPTTVYNQKKDNENVSAVYILIP